jgi:hypothetical protein
MDWLLHPCFKTWPRQRHRAILWLFAHVVVVYQVNQSVVEYVDLHAADEMEDISVLK